MDKCKHWGILLILAIIFMTSCSGFSGFEEETPLDVIEESTKPQTEVYSLNQYVRKPAIEMEGQVFADDYLLLRQELLHRLEFASTVSLSIDDIVKVAVEHDTWSWPSTSAYLFRGESDADIMESPYFLCMEKDDQYAFLYLEQCVGTYSALYIADMDGDGSDDVVSSFIGEDGTMAFHITGWRENGLNSLAPAEAPSLLNFTVTFQDDNQAVIANTDDGYKEMFHVADDLGVSETVYKADKLYRIIQGIEEYQFKIIDIDFDGREELMVYSPFCIDTDDGEERILGFAYQALAYSKETGAFATQQTAFVPVNSSPIDFSVERVFGYSPKREFLRYEIVDAIWGEDEQLFPSRWIENARAEILEVAEIAKEETSFLRGWLYDFDRDGNEEAILLLGGIKDETRITWDGNAHFVFVNANGDAEYLTVGVDESHSTQREIWRKMDAQLIRYPDFDHILIRSGDQTAVSGSYSSIYRLHNDELEHLLSPYWFSESEHRVFVESYGPQGKGPGYHFWDEINDSYATIGPVEVPLEVFLKVFDSEQIIWNDRQLEEGEDQAALSVEYTPQTIDKVEVYGNRFYHVSRSEELFDIHEQIITWYHRPDGRWELYFGPSGYIGSLTYGGSDTDFYVFDVDMTIAEHS